MRAVAAFALILAVIADAASVKAPAAVPVCSFYEVQNGDTIQTIAAQFSVQQSDLETSILGCTIDAQLTNLTPGQIICLPGGEAPGCSSVRDFKDDPLCKVYQVGNGDTWPAIASSLGLDILELEPINPEVGFGGVQPGMQLRLPPWNEKKCGSPFDLFAETPGGAPAPDGLPKSPPVPSPSPEAAFINPNPKPPSPEPEASPSPALVVAAGPFVSPKDTIPDELEAMYVALLTSPPPMPPPPPADDNNDTVIIVAAVVGGVVALALLAIAAALLFRHRKPKTPKADAETGRQKSMKSARSQSGKSQRSYSSQGSRKQYSSQNARQHSQTSQHSAYMGPAQSFVPGRPGAYGAQASMNRQFSGGPGPYNPAMGGAAPGAYGPPGGVPVGPATGTAPPAANASMLEDMDKDTTPAFVAPTSAAASAAPDASPGASAASTAAAPAVTHSGSKRVVLPAGKPSDIPYEAYYHTR